MERSLTLLIILPSPLLATRDLWNNCMYPEDETIASEPAYGWAGLRGNAVKQALEWFNWMEHSKNVEATGRTCQEQDDANDLMVIPSSRTHLDLSNMPATGENIMYQYCRTSGRWILCWNKHHLRIPRLFLARLWIMLSQPYRETFRLDNRRCMRSGRSNKGDHRQTSKLRDTTWSNMGMRVGGQKEEQPRMSGLCEEPWPLRAYEPSRRLLSGEGQMPQNCISQCCGWGKNPILSTLQSLYPFCNKYSRYPTNILKSLPILTDQRHRLLFWNYQCIVRPPK